MKKGKKNTMPSAYNKFLVLCKQIKESTRQNSDAIYMLVAIWTNEGALLYVRKWNGHLTKDTSAFHFPDEEPKMVSDNKYTFDRNRNNEICWLNQKDKKLYKSEKIVDDCLAWLVEQVAKNDLTTNDKATDRKKGSR